MRARACACVHARACVCVFACVCVCVCVFMGRSWRSLGSCGCASRRRRRFVRPSLRCTSPQAHPLPSVDRSSLPRPRTKRTGHARARCRTRARTPHAPLSPAPTLTRTCTHSSQAALAAQAHANRQRQRAAACVRPIGIGASRPVGRQTTKGRPFVSVRSQGQHRHRDKLPRLRALAHTAAGTHSCWPLRVQFGHRLHALLPAHCS